MAETNNHLPTKVPNPLQVALISTSVQQALTLAFASMILDGGNCFRVCLIALIAFWAAAIIIIFRKKPPSPIDRAFIRTAYVPICVIAFFLARFIWRMRGFSID
ncbi:MAG: hypothetical protein ACO1QB_00760 [Verrucomicrobiales bacterium]